MRSYSYEIGEMYEVAGRHYSNIPDESLIIPVAQKGSLIEVWIVQEGIYERYSVLQFNEDLLRGYLKKV